VKFEDLPAVKALIESAVCKKASLAFVRDKEGTLRGCVLRNDETAIRHH